MAIPRSLSGPELMRPESAISAISEGQTDFDENEVIITMENWTTIKRVPSLVKDNRSAAEKSRETPSIVGASLMRFVKEFSASDHAFA